MVSRHVTTSDDQDISLLKSGALIVRAGQKLIQGNRVAGQWIVRFVELLRIAIIVEKHAATYYAATGNNMHPTPIREHHILRTQVIVEKSVGKMAEMSKPIPLTSRLDVHLKCVIEYTITGGIWQNLELAW